MQLIHKSKFWLFLVLLFLWIGMGGFVLPWLISAQSTAAVVIGVALLVCLILLTLFLAPNPYEKEPS